MIHLLNHMVFLNSRHFQSIHRCFDGSNPERALSLGLTTDSETSDDAMQLVDRMKQLARCQQVLLIILKPRVILYCLLIHLY